MDKTATTLHVLDSYVAIDTETTGLDTRWCDLIEVSAVRFVDGKEVESFASLVKPSELPIDDFIVKLTGITNEELEDAPSPRAVIEQLAAFIGDSPVVGHNVCFDTKFIERYYADCLGEAFSNEAIDTLRIARHVFKDMQKRKLSMLVERCEKECGTAFTSDGAAHRALYDARAASYCYETMKPLLVELYGDDPEKGYKHYRANHSSRNQIEYEGITPTVEEIDESNPFYGASICFTGTLDGMTRREAVQHSVNLGAVPQQGVTKKLDFLVVGSFDFNASLKGDKSSKLKKAEGYIEKGAELKIVSDNFFLSYVK